MDGNTRRRPGIACISLRVEAAVAEGDGLGYVGELTARKARQAWHVAPQERGGEAGERHRERDPRPRHPVAPGRRLRTRDPAVYARWHELGVQAQQRRGRERVEHPRDLAEAQRGVARDVYQV